VLEPSIIQHIEYTLEHNMNQNINKSNIITIICKTRVTHITHVTAYLLVRGDASAGVLGFLGVGGKHLHLLYSWVRWVIFTIQYRRRGLDTYLWYIGEGTPSPGGFYSYYMDYIYIIV
jgi:hypothetical protein